MKRVPPRWADRFLAWYCRPDLLEEIQGDSYELYSRKAERQKTIADLQFIWNVLRFFRWKNIKRSSKKENYYAINPGMIKNILLVALRNFFRQPGHSLLNVAGLTVSFVAAFLILLWVLHETSFDRFHNDPEQIFKVLSHVEANGAFETYDAAEGGLDITTLPEVATKVVVINGTRWPNELCFRPEGKADECIYQNGIYASESFFQVFNFPILQGDQNALSVPTNLAISEEMAQRLYGGENPLGKIIKIDDYYAVTITSVFQKIPSNSSIQADFVLPLKMFQKMRGLSDEQFNREFFPTYLRVKTDVPTEALTEKLNSKLVLSERLKQDKVSYGAYPLVDWRLRSEFENGVNAGGRIEYVQLFLIIAAMVVFMAIINFINLSTARASSRSKEIGIRKVTGAFRSSIILQFIGESFIIVFTSVVLAILTTQLLLPLFNSVLGESLSIQLFTPVMMGYLLVFLLVVSLAAGTYPALVMSSFHPPRC